MTNFSGALAQLKSILDSNVFFDSSEEIFKASIDNSRYFFEPLAVVKARKDSDVAKVLKVANEFKMPVSLRGAGSGCSGGALAYCGGIVLDLSALNFIEIDPISWTAHVGAGSINSQIDDAAAKFNLMYPPDPSSKKYSTIGGNIACNAGGLRAAKYGTTRDYVLALSGFLPTGEKVNFSRPLRKFATAMNLRDLWIGSEGTLGVITEAWLKLVARPQAKHTALAFFDCDKSAFACVREILGSALMPAVLEFMDASSVECAAKFRKTTAEKSAILLIEVDGNQEEAAQAKEKLSQILQTCALKFNFAKSEIEAEELWEMRRVCSPAMFLLNNSKINQDIVLPIRKTDEFFDFYKSIATKEKLESPTFGHAADGNYHIHLMYDKDDAQQKKSAYEAMDKIIAKTVELGGAISGEHGIGITKSKYLPLEISTDELSAMRAVKKVLDPNGILNRDVVYGEIDMSQYSQRKSIKLPWDAK